MRLDDEDRSNVEDRRGEGGGGFRPGLHLGLGGTLVVLVLSLVFKQNLFALLGGQPGGSGSVALAPSPGAAPGAGNAREAGEAELEKVAVGAFNDAQRVWSERLQDYRPAKLVLFWDDISSGCGEASADMGPFYCPADERVYIDLGFYRELAARFGAPGEFAQAYVIAHEVGHHLQKLLGVEAKVRTAQERDPSRRNALSVRMELQADCFAGAWGKAADQRHLLDPGEVEQGLAAAAAVGDDRIQKAATGRVSPDTFTHGSAEQRARWFRRGFDAGDPAACDTFSARAP
jgi:predicted metalloprotease